jgi:hypothetical protein
MEKMNAVLDELAALCPELNAEWQNYKQSAYPVDNCDEERLHYIDVTLISRHIVKQLKESNTSFFLEIFSKVESRLSEYDDEIKNLISIGLLESIQNISSNEGIDFKHAFNEWLQPISKKHWDDLISGWENI